MAKAKQPRRLQSNEAQAKLASAQTSVQKAGLVLSQIRGKSVAQALTALQFSRKGISTEIKKLLESAIANAENNHDLSVDALYVKEAIAGKSFTLKRFHTRGRGRSSRILKPRTHLKITVAERQQAEGAKK